MYSVRILKPASQELKKFGPSVAKRVVRRIRWLSTNLDSTKLYPLKGDLSGLYKIREGSYRIIFEILHNEQTIVIHSIGHRKNIYKQR